MDNHITITITDESGVKQYNVKKFVKKALFYASLFLAFLTIIAVGTIWYLNYSLKKSEEKKEKIEKVYLDLLKKHKKLQDDIKQTKEILNSKKTELQELSNTLTQIETLIGLKPANELSLQQRVNLTKLSSENIAVILEFIPNSSPVPYRGITSKYGWRKHPTLKTKEFHPGTDLKAKMNTPIYATADGVVEYAGYHKTSGYGRLIIIDHNFGFKTYFGHLNKIKIKIGDVVRKGQLIGYTGNSGLSNGPHLHYEVRFLQRPLNPYYFIKWGVNNFNDIFKKEKNVPWQSLITMIQKIKVVKSPQAQQ